MPCCIVFLCAIIHSNIYLAISIKCYMYSYCFTLHICCLPVIDSKLKQQKLPAWQPIMTAGTVLPIFFAIGIAFIPLGVALLITSNNVSTFATSHRAVLRTLRISSLKIYSNALYSTSWRTSCLFHSQVQEKIIDYTTDCEPSADIIDRYGDCAGFLEVEANTDLNQVCPCTHNFTLDEDFRVYLVISFVV